MWKSLILGFFITISFTNSLWAQSLNCQWAQSVGGNTDETSTSIVKDASGNLFVAGNFKSYSIALGTNTLFNAGSSGTVADLYVAKYSPNGNVLWAKSAGGSGEENVRSAAVDLNGNVIIVGNYSSNAMVLGTTTISNSGTDMFIVKYSPAGNVLWANSIGGFASFLGKSISTDTIGNIFITGYFVTSISVIGTTTLTNSSGTNSADMFIVKFSPSGSVIWAHSGGGTSGDLGTSVCNDQSGNVYVSGAFNSITMTLGTTTLVNSNGTVNSGDVFIAKYSPSGALLWAQSAGGNYYDEAMGVALDQNGNILVTGYFFGPSFSIGTVTLTNVTNTTTSNFFVAKYSSTGSFLWAHAADGSAYCIGTGVSTDANGNVCIIGEFNSPTLVMGTATLMNSGSQDVFIAKYSANGTFLWVDALGGNAIEYGKGISCNTNNRLYITGNFNSPTIKVGNFVLSNIGGSDIFIAEIGDDISGIGKHSFNELQIDIYPNPITAQFTISFSKAQMNSTIKIIDLLGNVVKTISNVQEKQIQIDKGTMEDGVYFLQILDDSNNIINKKIIVQ